VRTQWDPERNLSLQPLPHRSIQIGLSAEAVDRYVDAWTVTITDVTALMQRIRALAAAGTTGRGAESLLPTELPYPLPPALATPPSAGGVL
jgi:hypothetical protein